MSKLTSDIQANLDLFVAETKENQLVWLAASAVCWQYWVNSRAGVADMNAWARRQFRSLAERDDCPK